MGKRSVGMLACFRVFDRPASTVAERCVLLAALVVGLATRIGWAMIRGTPLATGEASNVAIALAQGHGFADAFMVGQGPTAHLLPIAPAIAGGVYALFGVGTPLAEALLCLWSIGVSLGSYALLYACFARLGTPRWARLGALAFLLVAPIYTTNEVFRFRVWDGGLGLLVGNLLLWLVLRAATGERPRGFTVWLAMLPALAFFINPPIGIAAYVAWAMHVWDLRPNSRAILRATLATLLALTLLVGPWTLRNAVTMGHPILLRDDFGMELAIPNFPEAVDGKDPQAVFATRMAAIQPLDNPGAQRAMIAAGGEVAYSEQLGREARDWIAANPADFARLCLRHLGQMALPGEWMFMTSHGVWLPVVRSVLARIVAMLGFAGLAWALVRHRPGFRFVLPFVVVPVLVYMPFQPVIRYCWLIYPVLAYCAADLIGRIARWRINRPRPHSRPAPARAP